jgi:hypothetical protein
MYKDVQFFYIFALVERKSDTRISCYICKTGALVITSLSVTSLGKEVFVARLSPGVDTVSNSKRNANIGNLRSDSTRRVEDQAMS